MRVFALSDPHIDYSENRDWLLDLSAVDYRDDVLILAGDMAEECGLLAFGLRTLATRFRRVAYVPGNHELWVSNDPGAGTSLDKFSQVCDIAAAEGVATSPFLEDAAVIVPLLGWYDFTFGEPSAELRSRWMDFRACRWPDGVSCSAITEYFLQRNEPVAAARASTVISFSHFLPRIDVMPPGVPEEHRRIYPVLGTVRLGEQVAKLGSTIHVYGHSHVNRDVILDGARYVNNALGYPCERTFTARRLLCVYEG